MKFVPPPLPVLIVSLLTQAAGLLTLVALLIGVVRVVRRRDWRWLQAGGALLLLTMLLWIATVTLAISLAEQSNRR